MPSFLDRVDGFQRRHPVAGFPLAVVYKFFDDMGGYLAAVITYYAFLAIFPLLLTASSVLGFLLQGDQRLKDALLTSALSQFPIVGTQLGRPEGIQGSTAAVVIGAVAALYGILGLGQAAQHALNTAWAIPRNSRLNPIVSRVRTFVLFVIAGLTVLAVALLSSAASHIEVFGSTVDHGIRLLFSVASVVLNAVVLSVMMRFVTPLERRVRDVLPGALTVALLWQGLQFVGGVYVDGVINRASEMNGVFALVLGLVALLYVAAVMAVLGIQVNVVLGRQLWPRSLRAPFVDDHDLTDADRRAYESYALAQRHKGFETVAVTFEPAQGVDRADD